MTFFYDSFSLHTKLLSEGFEPEVLEGEFSIEFKENDPRFIKFLECVKFAVPHLPYQFVYNTLEEIEDDETSASLWLKANEILDD